MTSSRDIGDIWAVQSHVIEPFKTLSGLIMVVLCYKIGVQGVAALVIGTLPRCGAEFN